MGIVTTRHDAVIEVTLDWPQTRNALGLAEARELRQALDVATTDPATGAVVISANGKTFCAGGNLPEVVALAAQGAEAVRGTVYGTFQGMARAVTESPVPVIAAVDGAAVGFGCDLALAAGVTFIGANGWLRHGWIDLGLVPATGGTLYAKRRGGTAAVLRLIAADRMDGRSAESCGLAIACDDARAEALDLARRLAAKPKAALRAIIGLARIDDGPTHLAAALEHQVGFLTDPDFPKRSRAVLSR